MGSNFEIIEYNHNINDDLGVGASQMMVNTDTTNQVKNSLFLFFFHKTFLFFSFSVIINNIRTIPFPLKKAILSYNQKK